MPLLAQGEDGKLRAAATQDLSNPGTAAARIELGERWWDLAAELDAGEKVEAQLRAYHWYQQGVVELNGLELVRVEKRLAELAKISEQKLVRAGMGWAVIVIFRSAEPTIWNTTTNRGANMFAIPLLRVPNSIRYLRLTEVAKRRSVIIEMTKDRLHKLTAQDGFGWNGTNENVYRAHHLGVFDLATAHSPKGSIAIRTIHPTGNDFRGWGFGHKTHTNDGQSYSWMDQIPDKAVFEVAVKAAPLAPAELSLLLKRKKD
ncbi:hypothetical protein [Fimbriiglobus ruber]|uniref:Uncharacterized protein n=1 Tax=Fimbriiglobus ruber TaxID=1908690 RepID=A0A225DG60_9BACT|nr:hypothetical protein [Fimbriiglobus ruber]OWK40530.1 hypothetical protein FRUB_05449 [Fimbriiglobus ruber]